MELLLEDRVGGYHHLLHLPDDKEVARIINLVQQRQQASLEIDQKLKDVQDGHDTLLRRENNQPDSHKNGSTEPQEKAGAELEASEELIAQLEEQKIRIRADLEMLQGPLHPIRRCPTDILQEIFECIVLTEEFTEWLPKATILSHVCYRWRQVAIGIPGLWSDVSISLAFPPPPQLHPRAASLESFSGSSSPPSPSQSSAQSLTHSQARSQPQTSSLPPTRRQTRFRSPQSVEDYWTRTVERVRGSTAWVYIEEISDDPEVLEGLKKCRFDLLPNIQYLQFWLRTNIAAVNLATCELHVHSTSSNSFISSDPSGSSTSSGSSNGSEHQDKKQPQTRNRIRHLKLETCWQAPGEEQILRVDPTRLISRFAAANLEIIELGDFDFENFRSHSDPNLKEYTGDLGYTGDMRGVVFPNVLNITINNSWNVPLDLLAKTFPNAIKVRLVDIKFRDPRRWPPSQNEDNDENKERGETDYVIWPHTVTFTATSAEYLGLRRLKLPKVTYLDLPGLISNVSDSGINAEDDIRGENGIFTEFLAAHPTLLHLHTRNLIGCGLEMTRNASQLICLSIPASEATAIPEFSNLVSLRLFQKESDEISAKLFEKIVRKHFLPSQAPTPQEYDTKTSQTAPVGPGEVDRDLQERWWRCREPWERWERKLNDKDHPYPVLTILIPLGEDFILHWREHPLTACAITVETDEGLRTDKFKAYSFKWE